MKNWHNILNLFCILYFLSKFGYGLITLLFLFAHPPIDDLRLVYFLFSIGVPTYRTSIVGKSQTSPISESSAVSDDNDHTIDVIENSAKHV